MLILGIDTSTKICSCSIYDTELGLISETSLHVKKNHSNIIMPIINNLFEISSLKIDDIEKIAVSIGPGSFTGVRIGLGVAKGFAFALKKPLIAISELDILEYACMEKDCYEVISLIDARKERVYFKYKDKYGDIELRTLLESLDKDKKYLFTGDGAISYSYLIKEVMDSATSVVNKANSFPRASILCELAKDKDESNIYTLEPEYISKSRAEKNL